MAFTTRKLTCLLFLLLGCAFVCSIPFFFDTYVDLLSFPHEWDVPAAQAEIREVIDQVTTDSPDILVNSRGQVPQYLRGEMGARCIRGFTFMVFQTHKPLTEVAEYYTQLFGVESHSSDSWYGWSINDRIHAALTSVDEVNSHQSACPTSRACYHLDVYYTDDHTNGACTD